MPITEDTIRYENECTYLDFKAIQYKKEDGDKKKGLADFLKDVVAMANADFKGERYIVVGIKIQSDGSKNILGVTDDIVDEATYQQLILSKIEPELTVTYAPIEMDGKKVWVFTIYNCNEQPYIIKESYHSLKKGDMFIRKGSQQMGVTRLDLDRMYGNKADSSFFSGELTVSFTANNNTTLAVPYIQNIELPSAKAYSEIMAAIQHKKGVAADNFSNIQFIIGLSHRNSMYAYTPLEDLERKLKNVKEDYRKHDLYYLYETTGLKLNFMVANNGVQYLEDASIELLIPMMDGLMVAEKIYKEPSKGGLLDLEVIHRYEARPEKSNYPTVTTIEAYYKVEQNVGNVKHYLPVKVFVNDLRLSVDFKLKGLSIPMQCKIYGKNLKLPLERELSLQIT